MVDQYSFIRRVKQSSRERRFFSVSLIVFIFLAGFSAISFFATRTNATIAMFHPEACLGGWENPSLAQGKPDSEAGLNRTNSAVVGNSVADIFCGSWSGDIPKDGFPKDIYLRISWSMENDAVVEVDSTVITTTPQDFASSSGAIMDISAASSSELNVIFPDTVTDMPHTDLPQQVDPADLSEPVNPINPADELKEPDAVSEPISSLFNPFNFMAVAHAQEVFSTSTEITDSGGFLLVSYTLDGSTWKVLANVSADSFTGIFKLPSADILSWQDISRLQVKISRVASISSEPSIYLESMTLEVGYDDSIMVNALPPKLSKSILVIDEKLGIVSTFPETYMGIYRTDNPDTFPDPSYIYGAQVGSDGTLSLDASTMISGRFVIVNTKDAGACNSLSLETCRKDVGYIGESTFVIVNSADEISSETLRFSSEESDSVAATSTSSSTLPSLNE